MHTFPSYIANNIVLLWLLLAIMLNSGMCSLRMQSNEKDHHTLLNFKHSVVDPSGILSTWSANQRDCCQWKGVQCDNTTGRVTKLSLPCFTKHVVFGLRKDKSHCLSGKLNLSLLQLEFLSHLNLSNNDFKAIQFASSGNSSSLHYLDLSYNEDLDIDNLQWLPSVSSLNYMDLSSIDLHKEANWLQLVTVLPSLSELYLANCQLRSINPSLQYANFTSLQVLVLSSNAFDSQFLPNWLFNLSSDISNVDLRNNLLGGQLPKALLNLRNLMSLDLSYNKLNGPIPYWLGQLEHLQYLDVGYNLFIGPIPPTLANLSHLIKLDVSSNFLNGNLPESLGQLSNLKDLRVVSNLLTGVVSERNFVKLSNLKKLDLGSPGLIFDFDLLWVPPFQLEVIGLEYVGPKLPTWLYTQTSLWNLIISNSTISFESKDKFWNFAAQMELLQLEDNTIDGEMSTVLLNSTFTILQSNNIKGGLPQLSPNVVVFHAPYNYMSGSISSVLCRKMDGRNQLKSLVMYNSLLSGGLTDCWMNWKSLVYVNLGQNNLTGTIPSSMGFLSNLMSLHLNNNNLFGKIPQSFKNFQNLWILDLGENHFSGSIPNWIGHGAKALRFRSNQFGGNISPEICQLSSLIILDFADNGISGPIPTCLYNMTAMVSTNAPNYDFFNVYKTSHTSLSLMAYLPLLTKGQNANYLTNLKLMRAIDLSSNNLSGSIPSEIVSLTGLISLNLSWNQIMGNIPKKIGNLKQLESLDLSSNRLSGEIPQSIAQLSFLCSLNLSFNNFSGKIPSGTQLQGFGALSYIGNLELCGVPLPKNCTHQEKDIKPVGEHHNNESKFLSSLYIGMGVGFATSFWAVCSAIFFSRTCRHAYFRFLDRIKDKLYVMVALEINRFR